MTEPQFVEKFVAFIDILGFSKMVHLSEAGSGLSLSELTTAQKVLTGNYSRRDFEQYGPTICPDAKRLRKDLDFRVVQISDCAIISAEISPSGAMSVINHCWGATINLMKKGLLCRGYITRGKVHHTETDVVGSGYMHALGRERTVSAFAKNEKDEGTPFVEVDPIVCEYISAETDDCIRKMFAQQVRTDAGVTAIYPFSSLSHTIVFGQSDAITEKKNVEIIRGWIRDLRVQVVANADMSDARAAQKTQHYLDALDEKFRGCDETEKFIDEAMSPFSKRLPRPR